MHCAENGKEKIPFRLFRVDVSTELLLPYFKNGSKAGFPSPALDYFEESIDLNKLLIKHPASTYFARVEGDSLIDANVSNGDLLVLDKHQDVYEDEMYVCFIDGEFTVKYIERDEKDKNIMWLIPANSNYPQFKVTDGSDFRVWAKVMYIIKEPPHLKRLDHK